MTQIAIAAKPAILRIASINIDREKNLYPAAVAGRVSLAHAQDLTADQLVEKSIAHAGGWAAWMNTRTIQFRKTIVLFQPDEKVKETRVQYHKYILHPSPKMRIDWENNGSKGIMINNGKEAKKFANGEEMTAQKEVNAARGNTFGSHYVFCMPFKLRDPERSSRTRG